MDLVPRAAREAWLTHLAGEHPTCAFKAATQAGVRGGKVGRSGVEIDAATPGQLRGGDCVGADELLRVLKRIAHSGAVATYGGKARMTVGVVGYPNVGKSSVINSLLRSKATPTGDRPGITKCLQTVQLDKVLPTPPRAPPPGLPREPPPTARRAQGITLIDSPGVVVDPSASAVDLALRRCVAVDKACPRSTLLHPPFRTLAPLAPRQPPRRLRHPEGACRAPGRVPQRHARGASRAGPAGRRRGSRGARPGRRPRGRRA